MSRYRTDPPAALSESQLAEWIKGRRARVAFHEAGHAVAMVALDLGEVSSVAVGLRGGRTNVFLFRPPSQTRRQYDDGLVVACYAGRLAEEISQDPGGFDAYVAWDDIGGDFVDRAKALKILEGRFPKHASRHAWRLWCETEDFVREHWAAIAAVATPLRRSSCLTGAEVRRLYRHSLDSRQAA